MNDISSLLICYFHGGGFVAQTTTTHEDYLKEIAIELDVPILSVDYSLVPFPRALEEVFYAYCWALNNSSAFLGSTAEKVIMMGDSAGGNLSAACIIKCIEAGIKIPDQLVSFYGFFIVDYVFAPSRIFTMFDPVLHIMVLSNILNFYSSGDKSVSKTKDDHKAIRDGNYLISPLLASEDVLRKFPPSLIVTTNVDCGLDDSVEFSKKLKKVGVDVDLIVFKEGLPHGFLYFVKNSKECQDALLTCMEEVKRKISQV